MRGRGSRGDKGEIGERKSREKKVKRERESEVIRERWGRGRKEGGIPYQEKWK